MLDPNSIIWIFGRQSAKTGQIGAVKTDPINIRYQSLSGQPNSA
jgi:hypothetical protein